MLYTREEITDAIRVARLVGRGYTTGDVDLPALVNAAQAWLDETASSDDRN